MEEERRNEGTREALVTTEGEEVLEEALEEALEETREGTPEETEGGEENPEDTGKGRGGHGVFWLLGGLYLIYTAYLLIRGFITGEEGSGALFLAIGVAFGAAGIWLVFQGYRAMKSEKNKGGLLGSWLAKAEEEEKKRNPAPQKRSIAERARLAQELSDEAGDSDDVTEDKEEEVDG